MGFLVPLCLNIFLELISLFVRTVTKEKEGE